MGFREWASKPFGFAEPPARKTPTGTSYQASGLAAAPNIDSESGSSGAVPIREVVPTLSSPFIRAQTYAKMMNDASVDVSMRIYKTPVLGAEFFMEPYSNDPVDQEISEFIWANLAEGMSAPFLNSLEDILHMYEDGYSVLEKVYERREWTPHRRGANTREYVMLKKLGSRPASTIKDIIYDDNGGPETIIHNALRADKTIEEVELPITDLIVFTFNKKGGDITGKSLLRTAHSHWYYKTHMYKIDSIQKERHALGVPKGKLLAGANPNDKIELRKLLRNIRTNEEAFWIETPTYEISFETPKGNLVDVIGSANHHGTMILLNVLAQFIGLGVTSEGGGRSTAATGADMFMKSLRFIANQITEAINMYLIPELVVYNYKTTKFPRLAVRNIGDTRDIQMFASAIANLYSQEAITKGDPATENWLRKVLDMPLIESTSATPAETPPATTNGKGSIRGTTTGYVGKSPTSSN